MNPYSALLYQTSKCFGQQINSLYLNRNVAEITDSHCIHVSQTSSFKLSSAYNYQISKELASFKEGLSYWHSILSCLLGICVIRNIVGLIRFNLF